MWSTEAAIALPAAVLVGLGYAAYRDWRSREVADGVWIGLVVVGGLLGPVAENGLRPLYLGLWALAALLVLEHMVPWDVAVERWRAGLPGYLELAMYLGVGGVVGYAGVLYGLGPYGVPVPVLAVLLTVVLARVLFETGVLYGGADAKALMAAGLAVPLFAAPVAALPGTARAILTYYPFALTLLMNAAILAAAIPIGVALENLRRHRFRFPSGFTSYPIPVAELGRRFVWVLDPLTHPGAEAVDTAEDDMALRRRQQAALEAAGAREVWVTPQLPFIVLLFGGAVVSFLVGNLLYDLLAGR